MSARFEYFMQHYVPTFFAWLFFTTFAAGLLGMACETFRLPMWARPILVAVFVVAICWYLEAPPWMLPLSGICSALIARAISDVQFEHYIRIGNRPPLHVDYSSVNGGLAERFRGELGAIREALRDGSPEQATMQPEPDIRGSARRGIVQVCSRW